MMRGVMVACVVVMFVAGIVLAIAEHIEEVLDQIEVTFG